jgi:hypothetical protein
MLSIFRVGLSTAIPRSPDRKIGTHCGIFVAIPHAGLIAIKEIETKKAVSFQKQLSKYIKN